MASESNAKTAAGSAANNSVSDNGSAFKAVKDIDRAWLMMAYGVSVGSNYRNYIQALIAHMQALIDDGQNLAKTGASKSAGGSARDYVIQQLSATPDSPTNGSFITDPYMFTSPSVSDASVGGNDAINPYSAFNLDDDIVHTEADGGGGDGVYAYKYGMGRCYAEMYESKQQILYLTMGLPKYRNLQKWLKNATNKELSEMNDIGADSGGLISKVGSLLGGAVSLAIQLPWLPIKWAANIISSIHDFPVTEYFYFRDNMPMYYRYVNVLLSEIAVGMGIYGNGPADSSGSTDSTGKTNGNANKGQPSNGSNIDQQQLAKYQANMPAIMKEGPDIFKIMCRRANRASAGVKFESTDKMIGGDPSTAFKNINDQHDKKNPDMNEKGGIKQGLRNFWTGLKTGAMEGMNFLGFRIEKSENANESFSNSTDNSPLLNTLNNRVAERRQQHLDAIGQGEGALAGVLKINRGIQNVKNFAKTVQNTLNSPEATIAYMASGNGFFDLPKQWSGSAGMSRSLSFNMKLRAKTGGDNVSIFQSIMIPLSCLLAAALPRQVGDTTYTSPFIIRAFCKGMFAVPAGIITTLSVTRGSSEFGWSLSKLPTVVDVSFTIEDLSPMLYLSIAGGQGAIKAIGQAFANNTKMHEYINTLVGIGAKERYFRLGQLKRRLKTALLISKNTVFSATYRGYAMGDSSIIRSLMALTPYSWVKNN